MENLTETQIKAIVRKEFQNEIDTVSDELLKLKNTILLQGEILARLERLLLGEEGIDLEDTLKQRANFAYMHARRHKELGLNEKLSSVVDWHEWMSRCPDGQKESRMATLKRALDLFLKVEWLIAIIGITTAINTIPVIQAILNWINGR